MYETHIRITALSSLTAHLETLEDAAHLATLVRLATGLRTCVRFPDGDILGDASALPIKPRQRTRGAAKTNSRLS